MPTDAEDDETIGSTPTIATPGSGRTLGAGQTLAESSRPRGRDDREAPSLPGYQIAGLIGRGGMGEVVRGHDVEIGRDVAIKRLRGTQASEDAVVRFLREAKIQARLEHPAIIPVHTIGKDTEGMPYFTMKRITGVTLQELLARGNEKRQKLLRAFVDVCRAVDFAHEKRVVHRDLKPSNVMLGDFGEVYVLDWGLARVVDSTETDVEISPIGDGVVSIDGSTQAGAMLGTPGYMAPEQMEDAHSVGSAADVYALGSILFEILTGEPLHRKGQVLTSTLGGTDISPGERKPDGNIAPELDALCVAALAREQSHRPTARELGDRIEGFLDGDRDMEGRLRIAAMELAEARDALESGEGARRAEAMQGAGRALALNPKSREAADLITTLMLEPPREQPDALREQLTNSEVAVQKRQGRVAVGSFVAVLMFLGMAAVAGVTDWLMLGVLGVYSLMLMGLAFVVSRRAMSGAGILLVTVGNATLVALMSRMFGSLLIAPAVTCIMTLSLVSYPQNIDRARVVILIMVTSWMTPVVLEWTDVIDRTWYVIDKAIISTSPMFEISGDQTLALLVFANVMTIIVFGLFANKLAASRRDAQRQLEVQAWHLRQLLPIARRSMPHAIATPPAGVPTVT